MSALSVVSATGQKRVQTGSQQHDSVFFLSNVKREKNRGSMECLFIAAALTYAIAGVNFFVNIPQR